MQRHGEQTEKGESACMHRTQKVKFPLTRGFIEACKQIINAL